MPDPVLSVVIATHDNLPVLREGLACWRSLAADQPVELLVVEDGCTDGTQEYLDGLQRNWDGPMLRVLHEADAHELVCTNRGLAEARGELVMSWHDDMFLRAAWLVPELIATFAAYPEIGMLSLSRGLRFPPAADPPATWEESIAWERMESTIGAAPLNWARLTEVDGVMRPWIVRASAVARVGALDEAFRPTEWDESDLAYRIRAAGLLVATHGYERDGAYEHLLSTTYARTPSERRMRLALANAILFHERWAETIRRDSDRPRRSWWRRASPAGWLATARQAVRAGRGAGPGGA
jgi:glycosyltransferase involved in cell wall biosynthesis